MEENYLSAACLSCTDPNELKRLIVIELEALRNDVLRLTGADRTFAQSLEVLRKVSSSQQQS